MEYESARDALAGWLAGIKSIDFESPLAGKQAEEHLEGLAKQLEGSVVLMDDDQLDELESMLIELNSVLTPVNRNVLVERGIKRNGKRSVMIYAAAGPSIVTKAPPTQYAGDNSRPADKLAPEANAWVAPQTADPEKSRAAEQMRIHRRDVNLQDFEDTLQKTFEDAKAHNFNEQFTAGQYSALYSAAKSTKVYDSASRFRGDEMHMQLNLLVQLQYIHKAAPGSEIKLEMKDSEGKLTLTLSGITRVYKARIGFNESGVAYSADDKADFVAVVEEVNQNTKQAAVQTGAAPQKQVQGSGSNTATIQQLVNSTIEKVGTRIAYSSFAIDPKLEQTNRGDQLRPGYNGLQTNLTVEGSQTISPAAAIMKGGTVLDHGGLEWEVTDQGMDRRNTKIEAGLRAKGININDGIAIITNKPYLASWRDENGGQRDAYADELLANGPHEKLVVLELMVLVPPTEARDYGFRLARMPIFDVYLPISVYNSLGINKDSLRELMIAYMKVSYPVLYKNIQQLLAAKGTSMERAPAFGIDELQ